MFRIYGPLAENIRSFSVKYTVPKNHIWIIYELKCTENIRSSGWKYTVPKTCIRAKMCWKYMVLSLKIYGLRKFYVSRWDQFRIKIRAMTFGKRFGTKTSRDVNFWEFWDADVQDEDRDGDEDVKFLKLLVRPRTSTSCGGLYILTCILDRIVHAICIWIMEKTVYLIR